jgi:hypothetical protein
MEVQAALERLMTDIDPSTENDNAVILKDIFLLAEIVNWIV